MTPSFEAVGWMCVYNVRVCELFTFSVHQISWNSAHMYIHVHTPHAVLQSADKSPTATPKAYNPSILAQIPVKQLLLYAGQNHSHYASLYPSLLRLTATHLPQLCLVEDWLRGEEEGGRGELLTCISKPPHS